MNASQGSLTVVGIGISAPAQATFEASTQIGQAEKVFSAVADPLAEYWIRKLNKNTEPFGPLYAVGKPRMQTYREMVERITAAVHKGLRVCAVTYGHPGLFAYPFHESIRILRDEGYEARMLPGVSAEDCLFADLGIDPAVAGCRSYEATDFLVHRRGNDTTTGLVLWQIGSIAESIYGELKEGGNRAGLSILSERLLEAYRPNHHVMIYEAARLPVCKCSVVRVSLESLPDAAASALSTLYVPPMTKPTVDMEIARRLGLLR